MLHNWINLFDMTGAAGAQLIGLLFVVITLGTGLSASQSEEAVRAFVTPTLVNFSGVLFQAVVVLAPWPSDRPPGLILVLGGLAGVTYRIISSRWKLKADFVALSGFARIVYVSMPLLANAGPSCCWPPASTAPGT
jgi:hypothetical protein